MAVIASPALPSSSHLVGLPVWIKCPENFTHGFILMYSNKWSRGSAQRGRAGNSPNHLHYRRKTSIYPTSHPAHCKFTSSRFHLELRFLVAYVFPMPILAKHSELELVLYFQGLLDAMESINPGTSSMREGMIREPVTAGTCTRLAYQWLSCVGFLCFYLFRGRWSGFQMLILH